MTNAKSSTNNTNKKNGNSSSRNDHGRSKKERDSKEKEEKKEHFKGEGRRASAELSSSQRPGRRRSSTDDLDDHFTKTHRSGKSGDGGKDRDEGNKNKSISDKKDGSHEHREPKPSKSRHRSVETERQSRTNGGHRGRSLDGNDHSEKADQNERKYKERPIRDGKTKEGQSKKYDETKMKSPDKQTSNYKSNDKNHSKSDSRSNNKAHSKSNDKTNEKLKSPDKSSKTHEKSREKVDSSSEHKSNRNGLRRTSSVSNLAVPGRSQSQPRVSSRPGISRSQSINMGHVSSDFNEKTQSKSKNTANDVSTKAEKSKESKSSQDKNTANQSKNGVSKSDSKQDSGPKLKRRASDSAAEQSARKEKEASRRSSLPEKSSSEKTSQKEAHHKITDSKKSSPSELKRRLSDSELDQKKEKEVKQDSGNRRNSMEGSRRDLMKSTRLDSMKSLGVSKRRRSSIGSTGEDGISGTKDNEKKEGKEDKSDDDSRRKSTEKSRRDTMKSTRMDSMKSIGDSERRRRSIGSTGEDDKGGKKSKDGKEEKEVKTDDCSRRKSVEHSRRDSMKSMKKDSLKSMGISKRRRSNGSTKEDELSDKEDYKGGKDIPKKDIKEGDALKERKLSLTHSKSFKIKSTSSSDRPTLESKSKSMCSLDMKAAIASEEKGEKDKKKERGKEEGSSSKNTQENEDTLSALLERKEKPTDATTAVAVEDSKGEGSVAASKGSRRSKKDNLEKLNKKEKKSRGQRKSFKKKWKKKKRAFRRYCGRRYFICMCSCLCIFILILGAGLVYKFLGFEFLEKGDDDFTVKSEVENLFDKGNNDPIDNLEVESPGEGMYKPVSTEVPSMFPSTTNSLMPSLSPSVIPTASRPLTQSLTVAILVNLDKKPEETSFYLTSADNATVYVSHPPGSFAGRPSDSVMEMISVPLNSNLTFTISDSGGNGICCDWGNGNYGVFTGVGAEKKTIAAGDRFGSAEAFQFVAGTDFVVQTIGMDANESCEPCSDGEECDRCAWCNADRGFLSDNIFSYECHTELISIPERCFLGAQKVQLFNDYVTESASCSADFKAWPLLTKASEDQTVCVSEVKCRKKFDFIAPDCETELPGSTLEIETCQDKIGGIGFGYDYALQAPREEDCVQGPDSIQKFASTLAQRCCTDGVAFCSSFYREASQESSSNATFATTPNVPPPTTSPTSSQSPSWDGYPLTVAIQLDDWPEETGWKITSHDNSITFVELPEGHYQESKLVVQKVQIPEGTNATLTLTDSSGDGIQDGYFQIYSENGLMLVDESGTFLSSKSVNFIVGDPETASPTRSSSPSTSLAPSYVDFPVTIEVRFDQWSNEVGFSISSQDGTTYFDRPPGSYDEPNGLIFEIVRLPRDVKLIFNIVDQSGDGFCCLYGDGYYRIYAGENAEDESAIILQGSGEIGSSVSKSFFAKYPSSGTAIGISFSRPSDSEDDSGLDISSSSDNVEMTFMIKFDKYSSETGLFIDSSDGTKSFIDHPIGYYESYSSGETVETINLPKGMEIKFKIVDLMGDGICCWAGSGFYSLHYGTDIEDETKLVFSGDGEFGLERDHVFTVGQSSKPSAAGPPKSSAVSSGSSKGNENSYDAASRSFRHLRGSITNMNAEIQRI